MAYEEPGVKVVLEVAAAAVIIQSPDQQLVVAGELYEVFEEEPAAAKYDAATGALDQDFVWPAKKTASVVDLAGIRSDNAEPDDQLLEFAPFPMELKLRDPTNLQESIINLVTNVENVTQTGFRVNESATAATARASGSDVSAAELGKFYKGDGGLIAAGVSIGDRIRLTNGAFDELGQVTAFTDNEVTYDNGGAPVADDPNFDGLPSGADQIDTPPSAGVSIDGDIQTTPGKIASGVGGFTGGGDPDVAIGDRIAIWRELSQFNDGNGTTASTVTTAGGHGLVPDVVPGDSSDVGRRVSIESANVSDGAKSVSDAETTGTTNLASASITFADTDVGKLVRISGGTNSLVNTYRRIVAFGDASNVTVDAIIEATGAADADLIMFIPMVREIDAIPGATSFTYVDGTSPASGDIADASQVDISVIVHDKVLRDVTAVDDDNTISYSGTAVTSITGFGLNLPFDLFEADLVYEIFPDYDVLVTYRALDVADVDSPIIVSTPAELAALGDTSPNNPLLFAGNAALLAMGTTDVPILLQPVDLWADQIPGSKSGFPEDKNELLGFQNALENMTSEETAYYTVPLTRNSAVRDAFETHVDAMSVAEEKKERVTYLTYDLPLGEFQSTTGIIEPGSDGGNKIILDPGQGFISNEGIIPGKVVTVTAPAAYAGDYVVEAGTTDDELHLEGADWTITPEFAVTDADAVSSSGELITQTAEAWKDVDVGDFISAGGVFRKVTVKTSPTRLSYSGGAIPQGVDRTASDGVGAGTAILNSTSITFVVGDIGRVVEFSGGTGSVPQTFARIIGHTDGDNVTVNVTVPTGTGMTVNVYDALPASIVRSSSSVQYYVDPLSKDEQADTLEAISQGRANFRVIHLWPDLVEFVTGTDEFGNEVRENLPSFFAAAAEAGRDAILLPQRSSTGEALAGPTSVENSNKYFGKARLNTIANGGWAILEQPAALGPVEMRHLLSTDRSIVKRQELSVTKNVDNMSKVMRASLEPSLNDNEGRVNITSLFLKSLLVPFQGILSSFSKGKQLVVGPNGEAPFTILGIGVDPFEIDQINARADLTVPIPGNRVQVTFVI